MKHTEAVTRRCFIKKVFLKISQNSQKSTCAIVSVLIMLHTSNCNFINTFPAADEFTRHNGVNLPLQVQMKLSKKRETSCAPFMALLESTYDVHSSGISEIIDFGRRGYLNA